MPTPQAPAAPVFRETHLRDYWKVVWQGRWTILAVFVVIVGASIAWSLLQTPVYRATATVEVQPQARRMMAGQDVSGLGAAGYGWFAEEKYHNTQVEIIKSRDVAARAARLLRLERHPDFKDRADYVDSFRKMIRVDPRRDTGLLEISIFGTDPQAITQWVNAVTQAYVGRNFERARENVEKSVAAIEDQMAAFQAQLSEAEATRLGALQDSDTEIYDSETQEEIVRRRLETLNNELTERQIEVNRVAEMLRQIRTLQRDGGDLMSVRELADDATLESLVRNRTELERELESAKVELRPGNPEYRKTADQLTQVKQLISTRTQGILTSLQNRYDSAVEHERYLAGQIQRAESYSMEVARATSKYDIVKTDAETKKRLFDIINKTMNEVQLSAELMTNNVQVLDEAVPPLFAVKPRKRVNVMIGAVFGLFFGLAAVFFLDYLDNTIRTPEDVEKFLGVSLLGVVPKMQELGLSQRATREAYQSLRTSVIFSSKNRERKVILITSTGAQEGKSSTVANLGRTLAMAGDRVILMDCDLRRPKQHEHHGIPRDPGVTNYLAARADDKDWAQFLQPGEHPNLHIMTCGPIPPSPPELLGNQRFSDMLADMRKRYDWVLIDSPPAASLADSSLLASLAEMIVVVVRHNTTDRDVVIKTVQQLAAVNPCIAGVVLNAVDLERAFHKDYYYAGYYYADEDDKRTKSSRKKGVEPKAQVG